MSLNTNRTRNILGLNPVLHLENPTANRLNQIIFRGQQRKTDTVLIARLSKVNIFLHNILFA